MPVIRRSEGCKKEYRELVIMLLVQWWMLIFHLLIKVTVALLLFIVLCWGPMSHSKSYLPWSYHLITGYLIVLYVILSWLTLSYYWITSHFVKWVLFSLPHILLKNWKEHILPSSPRIRIWWSFNILKFCVYVLNPFLQPSHNCLNWRNLPAIFHKDICGQRTQLALCVLITSLDLVGVERVR